MTASETSDVFGPGLLVDRRYRIVRLVGKGGMGEIYEAEDQKTGSRVAIKTVLSQLLGNRKILARFELEAELSGRIAHPNVLKISRVMRVRHPDTGVEAPCMVMELLTGETLADRLIDGRTVSPEEAVPLVCQMALALSAAHRAGVVHRDLKPDNIFLAVGDPAVGDPAAGVPPRVVLTDFGVARRSTPKDSSLTASNVILGTPDYMAPEQLELEDAMPASDIYTLGLVMFEMITGEAPFQAETAIKMVFMRVQEKAPSPRRYLPDLDQRWEEVILKCLERRPEDRYQDAEEIVRALDGDRSQWQRPTAARRLRKLLPWLT